VYDGKQYCIEFARILRTKLLKLAVGSPKVRDSTFLISVSPSNGLSVKSQQPQDQVAEIGILPRLQPIQSEEFTHEEAPTGEE
jgi:hypothetical protein